MKKPSPNQIKDFMLSGDLQSDVPPDLEKKARARAESQGLSLEQYLQTIILDDYLRALRQQAAWN
jgi:predicted HicB family RNase H-like nuclease